MASGKLTIAILTLITITGCAGWKPSGSRDYNDIITNNQISQIPQNNQRILIAVNKDKLDEIIERNGDTFSGSGCHHTLKLYPLLYANFISKALPIYKEVAVSDAISDGKK